MNRSLDRIGSARRCTAIVAVSLSVAAWGCARHPATVFDDAAARRAILDPPRSESGNPPFYEVFGQRHFVLDSAAGYRRTGIASWYGEEFHGLATSSGETYDMDGLTAAHTTLPIPTWVEVTHLGNGKRAIVKVNDRGPFRDNRIIDLSYAAAEALGMVAAGTARVEVRVLGVPAVGEPGPQDTGAATTDAAAGSAPSPDAGQAARAAYRIYLQAGAFTQQDGAARLADELETAGYRQISIDADHGAAPNLYRVRLGPFTDVDAVDRAIDSLVALGLEKPHLVIGP